MKNFCKGFCLLALSGAMFISCNNDASTSKKLSKDSSEKKFDPAGPQKHTDTYDPREAATDTMYKNRDSIIK